MTQRSTLLAILLAATTASLGLAADSTLPPVNQRFTKSGEEVPNIQRHVLPLFGRLGCNGRSCHGSFQGQGGFRLSLFGYDFKADHDALLEKDNERIDLANPAESLILTKPTDADNHEGGLRYKKGGWEYNIFRKWVESGAKYDSQEIQVLVRLEVSPPELIFQKAGQKVQLKAVAVWPDGTREDVTPLCRFQTNDDQVVKIDEHGLVTSANPGDTHLVVFYDNGVVPIPVIRPVTDKVGPKYPSVATPTKIDQLVVQKLKKLGIVPSELAEDAEFLRRVSLDLTGTLPTAAEVEKFLADKSANKRNKKIDELLASPAYAAWWTTKLCDFTGNNDRQLNNVTPVRGAASKEWYDWIEKRVAENAPYDKLVEGIVLATSRNKGESYREYSEAMSALYHKDAKGNFADRDHMPYYWARNNFRTPEEQAIGFAYAFLGIRIQCAQCHKHPFDQWSKQDFEDFRNFFTAVNTRGVNPKDREEYDKLLEELGLKGKRGNDVRKEMAKMLDEGKTVPFNEVFVIAPRKTNNNDKNAKNSKNRNRGRGPASEAKLLGGEKLDLTEFSDIRKPLMDWMREKDNRYFARAFVNRVWAAYFNVGIVEPPDDLSLANPPSNAPLLDYLTKSFVEHNYDMKWLHKEILSSRTYQLSWKPNETNRKDEINFSHALPRRLPAEVAYDALVQATGSDAAVAKMQEDVESRAIAIAAASAQSRGRGNATFALTLFGRSIRESNCDCDRSMEPSLLQTVYLQNDRDVLTMIDRRDGWVDQVARSLKGNERPTQQPTQRRPNDYKQTVERMKAQIERLKKSDDQEKLKLAQRRLADYVKRFAQPQPQKPAEPAKPAAKVDTVQLVKQAYLRTLSRYPSDEELDRSKQYLEGAEDTVGGLKGLVWALLNTKEFIVNH